MSKEIKEKCKMCRYYNDKQQYPNVEGQTTHSNCISIKCQYRKITKDMQIRKLTHENKLLAKALELACREADNLLIKHEGWRFGLASENNFDKYDELEQKGLEIQGHCDYFKQQAEEEINNE